MPNNPYHRHVDYIRVSVTDRCNLRCIYCTPAEKIDKLPPHEILSYEEMLRIIGVALKMGISKVRLTGGEPLVRKGVTDFCHRLAKLPNLKSLSLTTNGVFLSKHIKDLHDAGIHRINISLDTLQPEKFIQITGQDDYDKVWKGIHAAENLGFNPIKLNVVVMKGINDDEILQLAHLTLEQPYHIRFIEFMPFLLNASSEMITRHYVSSREIYQKLAAIAPLQEVSSQHTNGPARYYQWTGAKGKIGLISPMSRHFCSICNRIRLTSDGKLLNCLFSEQEIDIKSALRQGAADSDLVELIQESIINKPKNHIKRSCLSQRCLSRPMVAIGG